MRTIPKASAVPSASPSSAGNAPPSHKLEQSLRATQSALRRSQRELRVRNHIAEIFLTVPSEEMYGEVLKAVLKALNSKHGIFGYIDEAGDLVCPSLTRDVWEECRVSDKTVVFRRGAWSGMWGEALRRQEVIRSNGPFTVPQGHIAIERAIAAPVVFRGDMIGVLHVANKATDYDEGDQELLRTIAGHVAPILHARLQSDRQREELRQHSDHLEETVQKRTADLRSANKKLLKEVNEHKQAEEALRESEGRFRTLAASVPVGIFQTDAEGKIEYVNQRVLKITGLTALEETADWRWGIDPHPDDREAVLAERTKAMAEGRVFLGGFRILTPQGVTRWVETRICPLFNEKGEQIGHAGMVEDVTQRRQAEEALRESEELFRTLYESSRDGIAAADLDGYLTECNRAYADMLGYSREELQRIRYQDITPSKWHALNADAVRQALERGYSEEFEKEYTEKDGTVVPVSLRIWRIEDEAGRPIGVWTIARDITERKQAEQALRESERRFRQVLEVSSDLVYKLDLESGTFDYVSPSAQPLTGFTPEEVIAMGFPGIRLRIHPEDWPRYKREINEFIETNSRDGATRRYEYRWRCKDDQYRWFEESRALVRGEDLPPLAVVGTIRDTTERKQAEEALRESENRFRQVLELSTNLIYRLDFESRTYDYVSPSVLRLSGFTEKEFAALGIHAIRHRVHPEDWPEFKRKLEEALEPRSDDGEAHGHEYRWRCKDGQYRWFQESVFSSGAMTDGRWPWSAPCATSPSATRERRRYASRRSISASSAHHRRWESSTPTPKVAPFTRTSVSVR